MRAGLILLLSLFASACAHSPAPVSGPVLDPPPAASAALQAGAKYVAMGSSFASGPGITLSADHPPNRCGRSEDNYAHIFARKRGLALIDVSCGGAGTRHILGPWEEIPAQIDAVDAQTKLVTLTIGGNDVRYIGGLMSASCHFLRAAAPDATARPCPNFAAASDDDFIGIEARMNEIALEIRRRAPDARLVFVDYFTVLPDEGTCAAAPMSGAQAESGRRIARLLAEITARAAAQAGADILRASVLSAGHDVCADTPWMNGYPLPRAPMDGVAYHPNLAGMRAVADALDALIWGDADAKPRGES